MENPEVPMRLDSSQKAALCFQKWIDPHVEELWIAALNSNLDIIEKKLLFRGTVNSCLIHPRDILRFISVQNSSSFLVAHNHPSGDPSPSRMDVHITKRIFHLGRLVEIPLNDHLILSKNAYFSFADSGMLAKFARLKSLSLRP